MDSLKQLTSLIIECIFFVMFSIILILGVSTLIYILF